MRFVLVYEGLLPSSGNLQDKHSIRKQFHPQLKRQWDVEDSLVKLAQAKADVEPLKFANVEPHPVTKITRAPFSFVPLVTKNLHLVCFLDITFLRPEEPGQLIRHGGDIDNRIKTLFDSLRVPEATEISTLTPEDGEDPFYCLLEDDSLVTGFQVRTERLLGSHVEPLESRVRLVITVLVRPTRISFANLTFLGGWL